MKHSTTMKQCNIHIIDNEKQSLIYYGTTTTNYGNLLLFFTEKSICGIHFLVHPLTAHLDLAQKQFKTTSLFHAPKQAEKWWAHVLNQQLSTPITLYGTTFQKKVWIALCQVPIGSTCSYQNLAMQMGIPQSTRAVANAIARNFIAILVPCHRVIRNNGKLGGYRWGLDKKAILLKKEIHN